MQLWNLQSPDAAERAQAQAALQRLIDRGAALETTLLPEVIAIVDAVRTGGDRALRRYAETWDQLPQGAAFSMEQHSMQQAWEHLEPAMQEALRTAAARIRRFAERQMPRALEERESSGLRVGQVIRALDAVGCYVPGGRHPLLSTMLMTVIPAQVAGVERIVVVSPNPAPETLAAAHLLGVQEFYRVGGAQAVAALAWGTESIAPVRKIVGPGNRYVTAAKTLVARSAHCGIDMQAGPTEIVVASESGDADAIAADLVAQAEHDPDALAVLVTPRMDLALAVRDAVQRAATGNAVAEQALEANGHLFVSADAQQMRATVNAMAPEHLTVDAAADVEWVRNAGSVFVGAWSPQPMGDYISGPNHTLPTSGQAALRGGLSVFDFLKLMTVQEYSPDALALLGPHAARLAQAEGLTGHETAILRRMDTVRTADGVSTDGICFPEPRARVRQMPEYHPPLGSREALRLDFNENTQGCSPRVLEALAALTEEALTRYPERGQLEARVAAHLGVQAGEVVLTNGVDEAIHLLCQTYLDAGDELLLPVPTYTMYEIYAAATEARVVRVAAEADFRYPAERLLAAVTPATRLIAIANPNSPTGAAAGREDLLALAKAAPQAMLLVDEAYVHFLGETVVDAIATVPNLVVARTFSKAYGLAGLRLGALVSREENLRWVRRVLSPYSVNTAALAALDAALGDEAYLAGYVEEVLAARAEFEAGLDRMAVRRWPSHANFVLVEIGPEHAAFCRAMRQQGVLVRDRSADPGCDGLVRITVGTRAQMRRALAVMEQVLPRNANEMAGKGMQ